MKHYQSILIQWSKFESQIRVINLQGEGKYDEAVVMLDNALKVLPNSNELISKKDKIVAVYTNLSEKGVRLNEIHKEWVSEISSITTYTTTNNKNLQEVHVTADQQVIVPSESVTTVIYNLK